MAIRSRTVALAVIAAAAVLAAPFATRSHADPVQTPPPPPPWVDSQGRVDISKMPARMPVAGHTCEIIGYVNTADLRGRDPQGPGNDPTSIPLFSTATSPEPSGTFPIGGEAVVATTVP